MTIDNDTTPRAGGADWEIGEAARRLSEALGIESPALLAAMSDYAAALGSKSTQMIAAMLVPLMQATQETRAAVMALGNTWEGRFDYMLKVIDGHLEQMDKRLQENAL